MFARIAVNASRAALARPATARTFTPVVSHAAGLHTSVATHDDAAPEADAGVLSIDKTNPLYAPDAWDDWNNSGYTNLAPKDHRCWEDLPFPYKYYDVKVDPADVESPGMLWTLFTNWKTALPATGLLALPMYIYDVFELDDHVMLAMISWFTFALLRTQVGPALGESLKQAAEEEAKEVYDVEADYRAALGEVRTAHQHVLDLVSDLSSRHAAERALRSLEADASSRELRIEQTMKMKAQLDYLLLVKSEIESRAQRDVVTNAFSEVAANLSADKKAQQASINDSLAVLAGEKQLGEMGVLQDFESTMGRLVNDISSAGVSEEVIEQYRELFAKKFGYADATVTAAMIEAASKNPKEMAVLTAKCGGTTPTVGADISAKMPIDSL